MNASVALIIIGLAWVSCTSVAAQGFLRRPTRAAEEYPELSLRLENPLARILNLPITVGYDEGGGAGGDGTAFTTRFSPVIPIHLNDSWHIISRSNIGWTREDDISLAGRTSGWTDFTQTLFLSPDKPGYERIFWGAGPSFILPTATDDLLGQEKFSLGPSIALIRQDTHWTVGMLAGQLWSVAGNPDRKDVNSTFLEPLVSYTAPASTSIALAAMARYDWVAEAWTVPLDFSVSKLFLIGSRPVKFGIGVRHIVTPTDRPDSGVYFRISMPFHSKGGVPRPPAPDSSL